ncbi:hypothetical protein [Roseinatronobacter bogoriensis]|uniref:hypothetical protein n=1 Tax=Roseinatronobacter bogoriensis TaxID=119542 RepID=UPI0008F901B6|nr:hypothetical protein [Rhodobaca]MBB4209917.1 hypothetical protein [Rhodobaca bogoriensis DSM 18756]TDW32640.1 hypothetical protein LY39_03708 [Rhodobaca barguzinensis]TDY65677.1 hypothetical protein EV660_11824 [Rhodobaca bogoriensis DSM 18756]
MNGAQDESVSQDSKGSTATALSASLDDLRTALLALKPTGPEGFEGLLATILGKISGQDFRLAKSGLQNGKDGATSATASNHISFEGKLYTTKINDNEVLTKITRLIGSSAPPDVWVLGATVEASTQLLEPMQSAAAKNGISIFVLDWPSASAVPPLAVACAFANGETSAFLRDHVSDVATVKNADTALEAIRRSDAFHASAEPIVRALQEPSLAGANARKANSRWLEATFADRSRAKAKFGQALAPNAAGPLMLQQRSTLVQQVNQQLTVAPSRKIVALVGGEGCGKSWLLAQSWLELGNRPLLVLIPANDLRPVAAYGLLTPLLISKLIQQTGTSDGEVSRKRWERRLEQWKEQANEETPRFILCVDGLNQQPGFDWPRWLDDATSVVEELGGALAITAREGYFNERIRSAVHSKIVTVRVPEWTESDLKEILATKGYKASKIKPAVLARLRNPRMLGIAFDLLERFDVLDFNELSVERLLFEHIRVGARDGSAAEPPDKFSKRLAQHAQMIMDRVKSQQGEDQLIFDRDDGQSGHTLSAELLAVTAEHFFQPLPEDPNLYTLADHGLSLALGLSIIKALQKAERNGRDVADALDELIEPIAALDKTADAVFSGAMVSSIDGQCSLAIRRALICGFLRLQNIDAQNYPAFVAIARNATDAAMWALFDISATSRYAANKDWLSAALRACRHNSECWSVISTHVSDWLRSYSLDPKIKVMGTPGQDSADRIAKSTEEKAQALLQKISELSGAERKFLEKNMLERKDYDPSLLFEDAFEMLAGMPLAGFAEQLVACSFSLALNASFRAPYEEYLALIRFNRRDWLETRQRLLEASDFLVRNGASRTGKWALVAVLRGMSTVEDAKREDQLVEELTKDREKFGGWRLVEKYCATDPCDPTSTKPHNIAATAERYAKIKVDEVSRHLWMGEDDHFVRDALPGLARFAPDLAIETHRKIARSIVARDASELVLGVTSLEQHCAMLDSETVCKLVEVANTLSSPRKTESRDARDNWITSQYAIQIAFPHMNGDSQLDILVGLPSHGPPLLKLAKVLKPAAPEKLEYALERAMQSGECNRALAALLFARHSGTDMTERSRILVGQFAEHERSAVRAEAMDIIAHLKNFELIEGIVTTGWSAALLDPRENYFEIWHGSHVIILAAEQEIISFSEALERTTPCLYSVTADVLGAGCHATIAARLTAAVRTALNVELPFSPPAVEQAIEAADRTNPPLLSLAEPDEVVGSKAFFRRMSDTPEDFEVRQRQGWDAFNRFETALTKYDARIIVDDVGFRGVDVCVSASLDHCTGLVQELLILDDHKLMHVRNFALMLAKSVSHYDPTLARKLFDRLADGRAIVSLVFGLSGVSLEAMCLWKSSDGGPLDDLRTQRLDCAANDHLLAQEVLAALMAGKDEFLKRYVRKNLESLQPADNARALIVVGFGLESPVSEELLNKYKDASGLTGRAVKSARFAYDRNRWARHWFEKMCATDSGEEFWAYSALFLKIVDARVGLWGGGFSRTGTAMPRFEPSIRSRLENRAKAWKAKREKTLCGDKVPGEVYLVLD